MFLTVAGVVLITVGLAGVRYAPAIVAAQHRQGMAPLENEETIDTSDRVWVTKGAGVVLAIAGVGTLLVSVF